MMPFFIFLGIIFFISLILFIICLSTLEIEIKNLDFNSNKEIGKRLEEYLIYIKLKFANKITWFKIKINDKKIKKYKLSNIKLIKKLNNFKEIINKNKKEILKEENINFIKELNIKTKKLYLELKISMLDVIVTSFTIPLISTILSIILANTIEKYNKQDYIYLISPIYTEKIELRIKLNCIINVKIVHIINIVYMLFKKRSVNYDERTSNRRAYVSSDE